MASVVYSLENKEFDIKRFNLANEPAIFAENQAFNKVLHEKGPDSLPITLLDGKVVKEGQYPTNDELSKWFGVKAEELTEKPKVRIKIDLKPLK